MTEQERDKQIREEIRRAKAAPRRKGRPRRILIFVLVLAVLLGAAGFAAFHASGGMDRLRRLLTYTKTQQDGDGRMELFRFDSDRTARYETLGDSLLSVSTTRALLLGKEGEEIWSQTLDFKNPAIAVGAKTAAVYDVGGTSLFLVDAGGLVRDMSDETGNGVLSVSLNASDTLALTTLKSGCRSSVTAFNASGAPQFIFNSSEHYVSDACVLGDNRHLAAVTLGETDGLFASTLSVYSFDSEQPVSTTTLGGSMVYALEDFGSALAVLQDDRLTVFDPDGSLSGSCRYEYPYLRAGTAAGSGFVTLLLSRYRTGGAMRLVTVGADGEPMGRLDVRGEVLDVSAAGHYVAVLYGDSLTVYTETLTEYATLTGTDFARRVFLRADGTAMLLGASRSWLYVP